MEVDTNELLHRIGAVLRGISDKMDRLIAIGERVDGEVRLPSEEESKTFADAKEPAKSFAELIHKPVEPILPKVGDWVKVTRPENWVKCSHPAWSESMHRFDRQVGQIEREWEGHFQIRGFVASKEFQYIFHRDWLSPAEPPKDEYREPVLPADAGKECEFSDDGETWETETLFGFSSDGGKAPWESETCLWEHARIKKDA